MIRDETAADIRAIREVITAAFGRSQEADLVEALRRGGGLTFSLVAAEPEGIVGHIAFSPVLIESDRSGWPVLGLAPLAVLPAFQRRGFGAALVRKGLRLAAGPGIRRWLCWVTLRTIYGSDSSPARRSASAARLMRPRRHSESWNWPRAPWLDTQAWPNTGRNSQW